VSFATFVVRKFFEWRIGDDQPPEKFAQAAKTFKHSITRFSQTALGKRGSPVGEQLVLVVSVHVNL